MQNFAQKKIALAVGASLMVMAGAAQAAGFTALTGATKSMLAYGGTSAASPAAVAALYGTTGAATTAKVVILGAVMAGGTQGPATLGAATTINTGAPASATQGNAADDVSIIFTPTGGTATIIPATDVAAAIAANTNIEVTITPSGAAKLRANALTGALEYSADGTTFGKVSVALQVVAGNAITQDITDNTTADAAVIDTATAYTDVFVSEDYVLAPTTKTYAAAAASKISGLTVDFKHPVTAPTTTELDILSRVPTTAPYSGTSLVKTAGSITAATGTTVTIGAVTGSTTAFDVKVGDMTKADWDNADAAGGALDIAAAGSSIDFNTGVTLGQVPMELGFKTAKAIAYTNIFNKATGVAATTGIAGTGTVTFAATAATATDGASPVLVSAVSDTTGQPSGTSKLTLTFSEPVKFINGASNTTPGGTAAAGNDTREVMENVLLGSDTLAALNLNADGTLATTGAIGTGTAASQGLLNITGIQTADLTGKQVTVQSGISMAEQNDGGYSATANVIDPLGGVATNNATVEALSAAATTITASPVTIAVGTDTTASAATTVADATKVGTIILKFSAGKEVALNTGKTLDDLASDLVVTVNGLAGQTPVSFKVYPKAADLNLSTDGSALTISLPTALIYQNMDTTTTMNVAYAVTNVADVLVDKNVAAAVVIVAAGNENVILPLSATPAGTNLLTQSITGTLSGASNGSLMHAHIWKWQEAATFTGATFSITAGRITDSGDKVATDLAIQYAPGEKAALEVLIAAQMNGVKPAQAAVPGVSNSVPAVAAASIPVYVQLIRSSDVQANTKGSQNYKEARAILSTAADDAAFNTSSNTVSPAGVTDVNPVYMAMLNPSTGAITGRLTGQLTIKRTEGAATFGPTLVAANVAEGLVDSAGKFNLIVATEPSTADIAKGLKGLADHFVILVHEDQANARKFTQLTSANKDATNYLPYEPNLYSLSGTRTVLGVAPGIAGRFTATTGSPATIPLSNQNVVTLKNTTAWQLFTMGTPAGTAGHAGPRAFIGINSDGKTGGNGMVQSFWTNDNRDLNNDGDSGDGGESVADSNDMAFAMAGNKVGVSTELATSTLSTIDNAKFVAGANTLAFKDGTAGADKTLTWAQAAPVAAKLAVGWSLATVPASGLNSTTVGAVLKVGAQSGGDVTWFKDDVGNGAITQFTAGTPVFVYSKAGGNLAQ